MYYTFCHWSSLAKKKLGIGYWILDIGDLVLGIGDWAKISQKLKAKSKKKEFFLLPFYFLLFTFPVPLPDARCPNPQSLIFDP